MFGIGKKCSLNIDILYGAFAVVSNVQKHFYEKSDTSIKTHFIGGGGGTEFRVLVHRKIRKEDISVT